MVVSYRDKFGPLGKIAVLQGVKNGDAARIETWVMSCRAFARRIEAIDWLAQLGYDPHFGARPVKRVIQKQILNELSKQLLAGKVSRENEIVLDVFDNKFVFLNKEKKEDKK